MASHTPSFISPTKEMDWRDIICRSGMHVQFLPTNTNQENLAAGNLMANNIACSIFHDPSHLSLPSGKGISLVWHGTGEH